MNLGKKPIYKQIFYFAMGTFALSFFIVLLLTNGYSMRGLFVVGRNQTFMDFFNSLLYNITNPYEHLAFYPPLSNLMYKILLCIIPESELAKIVISTSATNYSPTVKTMQSFWIPFIIYTILTIVGLYFALKNYKKGTRAENLLFIALIFFSSPMLFLFERANNSIVALIFTICFMSSYESENKIARELSLVSLAIAISFKIYPVLFCAMLVNHKRLKDTFKVLAYVVVLTIVPMLILYGGFGEIKYLVTNLQSFGNNTQLTVGTQLNFAKDLILPLYLTNLSNARLVAIGEAFKLVVTLFACFAALFAKKEWQRAALCCCIIFGYPATCTNYLLTFFIIPIIIILDTEEESHLITYISLILMTITQCLILSQNILTGEFSRDFATKYASYAVLLLTIILTVDGCLSGIDALSRHLKLNKAIFFVALAIIFIITAANGIFFGEGSVFNVIKFPLKSALIKNVIVFSSMVLVCVALIALRQLILKKKSDSISEPDQIERN